MDRREFLKGTVVGAGVLAASRMTQTACAADAPATKAVLRLCSQEGKIPGSSIKEKAENILKFGGCGLEFGGMDVKRAEQIRKDLDGTGVGIAAMCCGSFADKQNGARPVSMDPAVRKRGLDEIKRQLEACGVLGSTGVIWVPAFNGQTKLKPEELDKVLADILPELAEFAVKCKGKLMIEPLNKGETFYINRVEQGAFWCNKINSPGLVTMGDFYHMSKEEKDDEAAFVAGGKWVHHVHVATGKSRILPNQEEHNYRPGFKGLKRIGYQDFCSLECGKKKGTEWADEIPKTFALLKQQWEEATI